MEILSFQIGMLNLVFYRKVLVKYFDCNIKENRKDIFIKKLNYFC